jgi:UDP-N-acetylmuramoyl-tripeptide--D-alanyl-D-alanine ligase
MDIEQLYNYYLAGRKVSTDSRKIIPGCLFFALKGSNFNGNDFASEAIKKGALAAIVDEEPASRHPKILKVDDVLASLQQLARFHRLQTGIKVIAITGSNGKTTTKELCKAVLSEKFNAFATEGNLNNHIGVPLTLLSMDDTIEVGIVEMGANHPGEISHLCDIAQPDMGLITNIGKAHLEGFGDIQGVALAKGELFEHLLQRGKTIFVNEGNIHVRQLVPADYSQAVWYNGPNGLKIKSLTGDPFLNLRIADSSTLIDIQTGLLGGYNAENVLAACCVGLHLGVEVDAVKHAIENYSPKNNRSQLLDTGKNKIFMDAYNANPSSMQAAIIEFLQFNDQNKLLILGEMRELGESSVYEHEYLVNLLREKEIKNALFVGNAFKEPALKAGFKHVETTGQLCEWFSSAPLTGYFVFIKGSRSNALEQLIPLL